MMRNDSVGDGDVAVDLLSMRRNGTVDAVPYYFFVFLIGEEFEFSNSILTRYLSNFTTTDVHPCMIYLD